MRNKFKGRFGQGLTSPFILLVPFSYVTVPPCGSFFLWLVNCFQCCWRILICSIYLSFAKIHRENIGKCRLWCWTWWKSLFGTCNRNWVTSQVVLRVRSLKFRKRQLKIVFVLFPMIQSCMSVLYKIFVNCWLIVLNLGGSRSQVGGRKTTSW